MRLNPGLWVELGNRAYIELVYQTLFSTNLQVLSFFYK